MEPLFGGGLQKMETGDFFANGPISSSSLGGNRTQNGSAALRTIGKADTRFFPLFETGKQRQSPVLADTDPSNCARRHPPLKPWRRSQAPNVSMPDRYADPHPSILGGRGLRACIGRVIRGHYHTMPIRWRSSFLRRSCRATGCRKSRFAAENSGCDSDAASQDGVAFEAIVARHMGRWSSQTVERSSSMTTTRKMPFRQRRKPLRQAR